MTVIADTKLSGILRTKVD